MATALISSRVSAFFARPLYESLAARYMAPLPPAPDAAERPEPVADPVRPTAAADASADAPRQP